MTPEDESRTKAFAALGGDVPVRLYGRALGESSHVQVTRGFDDGLRGLIAGVVALDQQGFDDDEPDVPGATSRVALFTGPLGMLAAMHRNARHPYRLAMVAPNSNRLPDQLVAELIGNCTQLMAPSAWARDVVAAEAARVWGGISKSSSRPAFHGPTLLVPHGVHGAFKRSDAQREARGAERDKGFFRVLHMSTSDRQRKSTTQIVEAWSALHKRGALPKNARLQLCLDPEAANKLRSWVLDDDISLPDSVELVPRAALPPALMAQWMSQFHLVCQPSRAEGFGLTPLESRACGVPILATACTGHSEHMPSPPKDLKPGSAYIAQGCIVIPHGNDAPIDDLPGAVAPEVTSASVAFGLEAAFENWEALNEEACTYADDVRRDWAWSKVLMPLRKWIESTKGPEK